MWIEPRTAALLLLCFGCCLCAALLPSSTHVKHVTCARPASCEVPSLARRRCRYAVLFASSEPSDTGNARDSFELVVRLPSVLSALAKPFNLTSSLRVPSVAVGLQQQANATAAIVDAATQAYQALTRPWQDAMALLNGTLTEESFIRGGALQQSTGQQLPVLQAAYARAAADLGDLAVKAGVDPKLSDALTASQSPCRSHRLIPAVWRLQRGAAAAAGAGSAPHTTAMRTQHLNPMSLTTMQPQCGTCSAALQRLLAGSDGEEDGGASARAAVLDALGIPPGTLLTPDAVDAAAQRARAAAARFVGRNVAARLRMARRDLSSATDVLLDLQGAQAPPAARALGAAIAARLADLDRYTPSDMLFYNSPPTALAEVPGEFPFPLPADADGYCMDPGLHGPLAPRSRGGLFAAVNEGAPALQAKQRRWSMVLATEVGQQRSISVVPTSAGIERYFNLRNAEPVQRVTWPPACIPYTAASRARLQVWRGSSGLAGGGSGLCATAASGGARQASPRTRTKRQRCGRERLEQQRRRRRPTARRRAARTLHWPDSLCLLQRSARVGSVNPALLVHCAIALCMAPYNVDRPPLALLPSLPLAPLTGAGLLGAAAAGSPSAAALGPKQVLEIVTDRACAVAAHAPALNLTVVSFRGTKDATDVLTDITFTPAAFQARQDDGGSTAQDAPAGMAVHAGFALAFDSIRPLVDALVVPERDGPFPAAARILFTGHSMGGALAQLAAAHWHALNPHLVTVASPAAGNAPFCRHLEATALPHGGLRVWNEADAVPLLAQLAGYRHAGVPVRRRVSAAAVALYDSMNINAPLPPALGAATAIAPHIVYQVGPSSGRSPQRAAPAACGSNWSQMHSRRCSKGIPMLRPAKKAWRCQSRRQGTPDRSFREELVLRQHCTSATAASDRSRTRR
ncbi:hypothetical protein JKP88DRAFT_244473 [Tribonema minus]|uniref:Fungal lipase-type domain-containing protein n=1 Tax=Tribonema minus TaxID=303371 RepID=A0A835ZAJ7_9STRA|nr:hypothetical protein JKP88DRAFT_244473 [Tribonema minus]